MRRAHTPGANPQDNSAEPSGHCDLAGSGSLAAPARHDELRRVGSRVPRWNEQRDFAHVFILQFGLRVAKTHARISIDGAYLSAEQLRALVGDSHYLGTSVPPGAEAGMWHRY